MGNLARAAFAFLIALSNVSSMISIAQQAQETGAAQPSAASDDKYPLRLKVVESIITSRESTRPGWADVGEYISGHGRGNLITISGASTPIVFSYTHCFGEVETAGHRPLLARWKTQDKELFIQVFVLGVLPRPISVPPEMADCAVQVSTEGN